MGRKLAGDASLHTVHSGDTIVSGHILGVVTGWVKVGPSAGLTPMSGQWQSL